MSQRMFLFEIYCRANVLDDYQRGPRLKPLEPSSENFPFVREPSPPLTLSLILSLRVHVVREESNVTLQIYRAQ